MTLSPNMPKNSDFKRKLFTVYVLIRPRKKSTCLFANILDKIVVRYM